MWAIIAAVIAVAASAGVYYQQRKMEAQAKKQAQEAKAVQISGHDSNRGLYTVYGKALIGSTTVWKKVSDKQTRMTQTGFTTFSRGTGDFINGTRDLKSNRFLYRAVSLCAGPIQSVENILIDDEGYQSSRFGQGDNRHFAASVSLGPTAGQNFSAMRTSYSDFGAWGSTFTGKGVAYAIERLYLDNDKPAYQGEPSTKYLVKGRKLYDPRKDSTSSVYDATLGTSSHRFATPTTWEWSDNPVLALLDYMTNSEYGRGLALSVIDLESIADSADKCDVLVDVPARLTNTTGSSYDFYDPESGQVITVPVNTNIPNYRPEQGSSSQQKRFRINIAIDPSKELLDNIQEILNVFRGNLSYANGKYRVHMADVASPVLTIGDDDIISGLKISNGDRSQRMNRATVKFINANKQHKTDQASWPSLDSNEDDGLYDTYLTEDQGERLHKTFTIKGCTDFYQAQDTAEFLVRDSRSNLTVAGTFGSRCFGLVPGDVVSLTYDSAGYSGKYFRVMQVAIDLNSMNVNLQLKEYDSSVYTWNDARGNEPEGLTWQEEVVNASPTTPTIGTLSSTTRTRADGSTALTLTVPFSNIPEQAQYVDVEWGIDGTDQYNSQVVFDTENINQVEVPIERDNQTYAVRVRYFIADSAGTLMASTFATDTITVGNLTGTKLEGIEEGATANNIYQQDDEPTGGTYNDGDIWIDTNDGYRMYLRSGGAWVDRADTRIATAITDAAGAQATADGKVVTFFQDAEPTTGSSGDLWIDTNDSNKLYRYNGTSWDSVRDSGIASAISAASTAQSTADGKIVTFYQDDEPAAASSSTGDLWFDTNDNNKLYRYNGSSWASARDSGIAAAISAAAGAQSTADGKVVTFYQDDEPAVASSSTGDLWIDTNDNNKLYRFNGTSWDSVRDAGIASAISSAATAQSTADGKIVTFYQDGEPAAASSSTGDLWFDTNDNNKLYRYNGTDWVSARDAGIATALSNAATAQSTADGKIVTFYQDGEPAAASSSEGDLWIDTNDNNKLYRFNGTDWQAARDSGIASAISDAATAQATADGKVTTFYAASSATPTPEGTGDLWYQTDTQLFFRYNGSAWQEVASYNTGDLADLDTIDLSYVTDAGDVAALDSITETYISDDAISTPKIKAGAITVAKLKVTGRGSALNSDPNCQDSSAWEKFAGSNATFTTITDGVVGNNVMRSAAGTTWYNGSEALALDPAKTYRMTALVRKNAAANGTVYVGVAAFTQDGTNIQGDGSQWSYDAVSGGSGSTSWTRYTMEFGAGTAQTFPSNAATFKPIILMNYNGSAGYFEAQDVRIEEKVGADLIVDGSITAEKLDANTITGDKISTSSYVKAGSGANSAIMSGRATDNFAFWAGADFDANGGASGANAPFRVTRAGKVIMTNFALYSTSGQKLFDSTDGLLGLPSTQVAASTGSLVSSVSDELTSGTDYATIQLSSTQTITVDFDYPLNYLFASGSSEANAYGQIATSITVTIQKSTDASTWSTFGSATFNKTDSSSASTSQYYVQKQTVYLGSEFGGGTLYFASLQPGGAVDDGNVLNGNVSASLATGTHYLRMQVTYGGSGLAAGGIPSTTAARSITLTTTGAGFTVDSSGNVSDGVSTSATTGWVLSNFVEKTESDNVTINGTLTLGGDLVVNGTTTTINSTTLEIDDKNIVLASGAADGAAANGAGITIDGVNATLTYDNADGNWLFNKALHMVGTQRITNNGFAGIEYHNTDGTWEGFIGTENNTGNLRYNSRLGTHKWYSNSTEIAALTSSALDVPALQIDGTTAIDSSRGASLTGATITGITNTQRDIRSAGQIRATGWYNDAASTDYTGLAAEIGVSSGVAHLISYNRSTSAYGAMRFDATSFTFGNSVSVSGNLDATQLLVGGTTVVNSSRDIVGINDISIGDTINFEGALRAYVSASDRAHQRADARDESTNYARLHWYGVNDTGGTSNFRHAWYDGNAYVNVTATGASLSFDSGSSARHVNIGGSATTTSNPSGLLLLGRNSSSQTFNLEIMNRGNHSSASFTDKIDFSINNNGTYYYSALRFGKYGDLETKQVIANAAAPYAATDRYFKLTNDAAGKSGTLVTANNGNTWLNADGGKELWLNWYSLSSTASKADLSVGDGDGGVAILKVDGSTRRVGVNNASPSYPLDVTGNFRATGSADIATSGGLLHLGDSSGGNASGAAQLYYHASSKSLRFYALDANSAVVAVNQYQRYNGTSYEKVWDSGNHGAGSNLDADLLDGEQGTYYRQSFVTLDSATRTNYDLGFKPASGNYAGFRFFTQAGDNAGYLLVRADTATGVYDANGITLVSDAGKLTLANRTGSSGIRFMTGSTATTKLELTASGVLQHTIPGNLLDGTLYSGYTMNVTGASTFGGMRFDRNGTAKYRVGLKSDDMFQIANFNLSSGADNQFLISANGHVLIGTTVDTGLGNNSIRVSGSVDTGIADKASFRLYDGATFKGGFGSSHWATGAGGNGNIALLASDGRGLEIYTGGVASVSRMTIGSDGTIDNPSAKWARTYHQVDAYASGGSANNVHTHWGVLCAGSDNSAPETYTIIETNIDQDAYRMGGFTILLMDAYGDHKTRARIDLAGYWNPESNGGFVGWGYTTTNPRERPTIYVMRNSTTGKVAFAYQHSAVVGSSYPVIVACDLWIGYSGSAEDDGKNWSIKQQADLTGYTNTDQVNHVGGNGNYQNNDGSFVISKSSGNMLSHGSYSDAIGYNTNYGTYIGGAGGRYVYSGLSTHPIFFDGSTAQAIHHNGGQISNTYAGDHTFDSGNTSAGGIVIQGSSTGGPRLGIKSTGTGGKEWWLISNNSGNTDGTGYLQFWNHTNGVTAATWSYAAGTRSNIYTPLKVEAKAQPPIFTSTTSGDWRPTLAVDTSGQLGHGILVNQTRSDYWAQAISTQGYGLYIDSHVTNSGTSLLRCEIGGSTQFNVRGDGNVYVAQQLDVGINSYGHLHLRAYGTLGGYRDAHSPNGSFAHMDVRDDGNQAKPHKYTYHPTHGYGQYKENWWDGNSYHEIGSISDAIRTNGNFVASGNVTAYGTYSDRRLKENIRPFTSARELIKGINVYQFNYIGKDDDLIGVIAQEVEETLPQLVYELIDTDSDELRKAVRYDHLSAVLLKAVKEQDEEIQELKALVKTLMEKLQ